jgi:hypothetical protein
VRRAALLLAAASLAACGGDEDTRVNAPAFSVELPSEWRDAGGRNPRTFTGPSPRGLAATIEVHEAAAAAPPPRAGRSPERVELDGAPALRGESERVRAGQLVFVDVVTATRGGRSYRIEFAAAENSYEGQRPDFERVLDSWRWRD